MSQPATALTRQPRPSGAVGQRQQEGKDSTEGLHGKLATITVGQYNGNFKLPYDVIQERGVKNENG